MSATVQLEVLVEERSAEHALAILLPRIVPGVPFAVRSSSGKQTLIRDLPRLLRGYAARLSWERIKIVVLVDRDDDDCVKLKARLDCLAGEAGLATPSTAIRDFVVLNRIVVEELLEAWFFGDVSALRGAYPRVPSSLGEQAGFRDPDAIAGGTWQALERILRGHGYHPGGLRKVVAAMDIAPHMDVENNRSRSFQMFRDGLRRLVSEGPHA